MVRWVPALYMKSLDENRCKSQHKRGVAVNS